MSSLQGEVLVNLVMVGRNLRGQGVPKAMAQFESGNHHVLYGCESMAAAMVALRACGVAVAEFGERLQAWVETGSMPVRG